MSTVGSSDKNTKLVGNGLRPRSISNFRNGLSYTFERGKSDGVNAVYHFTFTGEEERKATVIIRNK